MCIRDRSTWGLIFMKAAVFAVAILGLLVVGSFALSDEQVEKLIEQEEARLKAWQAEERKKNDFTEDDMKKEVDKRLAPVIENFKKATAARIAKAKEDHANRVKQTKARIDAQIAKLKALGDKGKDQLEKYTKESSDQLAEIDKELPAKIEQINNLEKESLQKEREKQTAFVRGNLEKRRDRINDQVVNEQLKKYRTQILRVRQQNEAAIAREREALRRKAAAAEADWKKRSSEEAIKEEIEKRVEKTKAQLEKQAFQLGVNRQISEEEVKKWLDDRVSELKGRVEKQVRDSVRTKPKIDSEEEIERKISALRDRLYAPILKPKKL
eukprot:TRINITY_DN3174_c0_g2_i1.p1 TRINITY_DN3174_c0_g2~~TRINITY_DN3174_c0_g2_i1.p1  ORF type:complete len:353 (-),score=168.42 TRINITY_DN3174_c0_g2_i1:148-1125(-)